MSPWTLNELETCRSKIKFFEVVDYNFMEVLYFRMGGVPRYVLQTPADILSNDENAVEAAEKAACSRVNEAIETVEDAAKLLQCFAQGMESKEFSGRILHRWPTADHNSFYLDWASPSVKTQIVEKLKDQAWKKVLTQLTLDIPVKPNVKNFKTPNELSALSTQSGTLFTPTIPNFPCIDSALGPDTLFQVTISSNYPIKQTPLRGMLEEILGKDRKKKIRLIFVVPDSIYTDFKAQNYHTEKDVLSSAIPKIIRDHVDQYAMRINLDTARRGGSPGSSGGVQGSNGSPGSSSGVSGSSGSPGVYTRSRTRSQQSRSQEGSGGKKKL
ncbi:hypothetical protein BGX21_006583 [Mortierella sp. AD011]|nr:hypothetical protein BGX21_006583 [Mortierella sp. AD011]